MWVHTIENSYILNTGFARVIVQKLVLVLICLGDHGLGLNIVQPTVQIHGEVRATRRRLGE